jgi:hypothetical protein
MWIDAVCINQASTEEKSIQVANMGRVFATADRVISWLGPEENNSNIAFPFLQNAARRIDMDWDEFEVHPSEVGVEILERLNGSHSKRLGIYGLIDALIPWDVEEAKSVCTLLGRPYFERAWVLQEVRLAKHVLLQCGFATLAEEDFWKTTYCLPKKDIIEVTKNGLWPSTWVEPLLQVKRLGIMRSQRVELSYHMIRQDMRTFHCRDPRDRMYSVLGLLRQKDRELKICPDYSRDIEEVYVDIVQHILKSHHSLELLQTCELATRSLNIPSWVPDWSKRTSCLRPLRIAWSACGFISSHLSLDRSGLRCNVSGIQTTHITEATEYPQEEYLVTDEGTVKFLKAIQPSPEVARNPYKTGRKLIDVYRRTLTADTYDDIRKPDSVHAATSSQIMDHVWSTELSDIDYTRLHDNIFFLAIHEMAVGRCFVTTGDGYVGLAPTGTQVGDVVCVLLGSHLPLVLRPAGDGTWEVVGTAFVMGLMRGETVYRGKHAGKYRVEGLSKVDEGEKIDGHAVALCDETDGLKTDPAELLEEVGIRVEKYTRDPHELVVLPETLRDAGVGLEEFVLV